MNKGTMCRGVSEDNVVYNVSKREDNVVRVPSGVYLLLEEKNGVRITSDICG